MGSKLESGWTTERGASKHGTVVPNDHHQTTQAPALGAATVCRDIVDHDKRLSTLSKEQDT